MTLRQIDSFVGTLRSMVTLDGMSQIPQKTFELMAGFNGWMRRVAHISRQGCIKRLERRHNRRRESKKIIKNRLHKCNCRKCKRRMTTKNVKPDFLANMAYELRVSQENPPVVDETVEGPEDPKVDQEDPEKPHQHTLRHRRHHRHHRQPQPHLPPVAPYQDYRYLQQSDCTGLAWWTDMNHQVYMPPLIQNLSLEPTRSECSSVSEFRTGSPVFFNHIPSREDTSDSDNSDYKSCRDGLSTCYHFSSKSDAKIPLNPTLGEKKPVGRSASMPLGQKPRELRGLQMAAKRKLEKKRPVRSTSHTTDSFSNCVKCSRIVFRSFKKMTC